jgi:hypothetical protein
MILLEELKGGANLHGGDVYMRPQREDGEERRRMGK